MRQLAEKDPVRPRSLRPELDRDIDTIIMKCLEKSPHRRYGSCEALAEDLERWMDHWPIHARPGNMTTRAFKWARRRPGVAGLTTALVLTALIGLVASLIGWNTHLNQLWNSLLADARYWRGSKQPGQRFEAIACLQSAADIKPSIELQNEAVAALALSDLRAAETWEGNPDRHPLVALSRDVRLSACPREDGSILVFEREKLRATLPGGGTPVNAILRFSADGRWLAAGYGHSGVSQSSVKVWDWMQGKALLEIDGVTGVALDFWPDGSAVAAGVGSELRFHALPGGDQHRPAIALPAPAYCVRISPSGGRIAASLTGASSHEGDVVGIDLDDRTAPPTVLKNGSAVRMLSWHPRLDWIAAPCGDGAIRIWDARSGAPLQTIPGHVDHVTEALWNPKGDIIASSSADGTLKLWDACTGDIFVTMEHPMGPLVFSNDGTRLGPGIDGTGVRLFEVAPLEICRRLRSPPDGVVWSAAFSHDGGLLATADKKVRLWNKEGYELATLPFANPRSVLFGKDSMIVTGHDGVVRWPLRTETDGKTGRAVLGSPQRLAEREHEWEFAAISADESMLAVASAQEVALLSLSEPQPTRFLPGHDGASYVALSHDGKFVATGTASGPEVWVWNCDTGKVEAKLPVRGGACVAFTEDG
jgi:WD40 repeat protein